MALEQVDVDQVMREMAAHPEVWVSSMPELKEVAALLHGENVRRAIEILEKLGFVVAREMPEEPEPMADLTALTLTALNDDELFTASVKAIQRAAQGEADGGDEPSYTIAMDHLAESDRRLVAQGHRERCRVGIYSQAYEAATALHSGDRTPRTLTCNCGAVDA